jgi:hypothetical protein
VTLPRPERISSILRGSADKLAMIDSRNDSQMIFYDQLIPGSTLVGYLNADHWAIVVPIARTHDTVASLFVTQERLSSAKRCWRRCSASSRKTLAARGK